MRFAIVMRSSNYVVRRFQAANESSAIDVFKKFLKEGVKDDCHENFFFKPLAQKRANNNEQ